MFIVDDGTIFRNTVTSGQLRKQSTKLQQYAKSHVQRKLHKSTKCVSFLHSVINFCLQQCVTYNSDNNEVFLFGARQECSCHVGISLSRLMRLMRCCGLYQQACQSKTNTATNRIDQNYLRRIAQNYLRRK
jgi:hypothetical protein